MSATPPSAGRLVVLGLAVAAVILGLIVVRRIVRNPQTDDAIVMADVVAVVPQGSGTIRQLRVAANQTVKQGDVLFVVDPRPYEFAVQRARAEVAALDGEIDVTQRKIGGQQSAVEAARAGVRRAEAQAQNASDSL